MRKVYQLVPKSNWTRIVLILLRVAIGWHLFIEGVSKLESMRIGPSDNNRVFSSRGYLQNSAGPLAPLFKKMAGDPDAEAAERLDAGDGIPRALEAQWRTYAEKFEKHYGITGEQKQKLDEALAKRMAESKEWFQTGSKQVTKSYSFTTTNPIEKNTDRISEYKKKLAELKETESLVLAKFDKDVLKTKLNALKADVARLRSDLLKDLDDQAAALRTEFEKLLTPAQKDRDNEAYSATLVKYLGKNGYGEHHKAAMDLVLRVGMDNRADLLSILDKDPAAFLVAVRKDEKFSETFFKISKEKVAPNFKQPDNWMLDFADLAVAWGLTLAGAGLILGLFTRLSCIVGAGLLLMFFLALPPLPGLPDNPMAEGKYLFVNKNLIEMLALLALATMPSGRWLGLDALLAYIWPFKKLAAKNHVMMDLDPPVTNG